MDKKRIKEIKIDGNTLIELKQIIYFFIKNQ
jgi:hypothetical protein